MIGSSVVCCLLVAGPLWLDAATPGGPSPVALLLGQMVLVLLVGRALGAVCRRVGQPAVVGEMAAGIALGPSLLGRWEPAVAARLFPPTSLPNLWLLSQVGLILFMFGVGMDLDVAQIRGKARQAVLISCASIALPLGLGWGVALACHQALAPSGVPVAPFGWLLGIAMSITAFPVLARMVQERGMQGTPLGALVVACAAADDLAAWCLLAAVVAWVKAGSLAGAVYPLASAAAFGGLMVGVVRPWLARVGRAAGSEGRPPATPSVYFLVLVASACVAEAIGVHALFGAFLAGACMPADGRVRQWLRSKVQDVAVVLLLPLFFVITGLRTEIGALHSPYLWGLCAALTAVAVAGKLLGSGLTARLVGYSWPDSLRIGALMNTRGLMEVVVLNIGYDLGILSATVFTMMVIMALVTTCLTGPALNLIQRWEDRQPR